MGSARHPLNAPGEWYVDTRCIDCSAARTEAPGLIISRGGQSVFAKISMFEPNCEAMQVAAMPGGQAGHNCAIET